MTPAWTILSAIAGAILLLCLPARAAHLAKFVALVSALIGLCAAAFACYYRLANFDLAPWSFSRPWIPEFGIALSLEANGLSLALLLLTGIVAVAGILFSWNVCHRQRAFFAFYLTIIGGVYGVFLSSDAFLLFFFYELVILPKYFLIAIWGSKEKEYGAMKLTLYSIGASALILIGLVAAYAAAGATSFDIHHLAAANYSPALQAWAFPVLFLGFAVLAGIWPFHTWAPTGHAAAPTAASTLLAGVVMKLGAYGALFVALPLFPLGFAQWQPVIGVLAVIGILHGALTALARKDLKLIIGYSSVSHMGFVLLGIACANHWGFRGAALQMISHGIIAGLLFGIAGRVVYDRTHTRDLAELRTFNLWHALPGASITFILATSASIGLPGFSGFVAELSVLIGTWQARPWLLVPVVFGIVFTAAFSLRALNAVFLPDRSISNSENAKSGHSALPPLTVPEFSAIILLMLASLAIGIFPQPWIALIDDGLRSPLFHSFLSQP